MIDQTYYTPDDIPIQFKRFDDNVVQLDVGKSGKVGILDLELQKNQQGKTIIARQFSQVPLQIQRALYPENALPNMAYLYIVSPSGGILQGDRLRTDIVLKNNAASHITTQGATRIYSMNSNYASQMINITLNDNCYLEFIPDQIIPYKSSRYYQKVELKIHDTATLVYSEVLTSGRMAMKESFQYDICCFRTRCTNQDNQLQFFENVKITPKSQKLTVFGMFEKYSIVGTVYIVSKGNLSSIETIIHNSILKKDDVIFGTSIFPDNSGILVRILGQKTKDVITVIHEVVKIIRREILGAESTYIPQKQ